VLSVVLGILFVLAGTIKLTDILNPNIHNEMILNFQRFIVVWPLIANQGIQADQFRIIVGASEAVAGFLLILQVHWLVNVFLAIVMVGAALTHNFLGEPLTVPVVLFILLLLPLLLPANPGKGSITRSPSKDPKRGDRKKAD